MLNLFDDGEGLNFLPIKLSRLFDLENYHNVSDPRIISLGWVGKLVYSHEVHTLVQTAFLLQHT